MRSKTKSSFFFFPFPFPPVFIPLQLNSSGARKTGRSATRSSGIEFVTTDISMGVSRRGAVYASTRVRYCDVFARTFPKRKTHKSVCRKRQKAQQPKKKREFVDISTEEGESVLHSKAKTHSSTTVLGSVLLLSCTLLKRGVKTRYGPVSTTYSRATAMARVAAQTARLPIARRTVGLL